MMVLLVSLYPLILLILLALQRLVRDLDCADFGVDRVRIRNL